MKYFGKLINNTGIDFLLRSELKGNTKFGISISSLENPKKFTGYIKINNDFIAIWTGIILDGNKNISSLKNFSQYDFDNYWEELVQDKEIENNYKPINKFIAIDNIGVDSEFVKQDLLSDFNIKENTDKKLILQDKDDPNYLENYIKTNKNGIGYIIYQCYIKNI